jgi:hypothetical protein
MLGKQLPASDLKSLPHGVYMIRTASGTQKVMIP